MDCWIHVHGPLSWICSPGGGGGGGDLDPFCPDACAEGMKKSWGVDLLGNLPGCVCQKVREMGYFSA